MKMVKRVIIATILLVVFIALMFFGNLARLFILEKKDLIIKINYISKYKNNILYLIQFK